MRDVMRDANANRLNKLPKSGKHNEKTLGTEPGKTIKNAATTKTSLSDLPGKMSKLGVESTSKPPLTKGVNATQRGLGTQKSTASTKSIPMAIMAKNRHEKKMVTRSQTAPDRKATEEAKKLRQEQEGREAAEKKAKEEAEKRAKEVAKKTKEERAKRSTSTAHHNSPASAASHATPKTPSTGSKTTVTSASKITGVTKVTKKK
jgi:peptidoglycan hydrolase CwlO-like protein